MSLLKNNNESETDYHKRLVYGKLIDKTLSDYDYSELAPYVYGKEYSTDVARRMMYGSCKTLQLLEKERVDSASKGRDSNELEGLLSELENKTIELQIERQKFFDQRNAFKKIIRERARQEELNEIIIEAVNSNTLPSLLPLHNNTSTEVKKDITEDDGNDLLVSLNDLHFGAYVDNYWCKYDSSICATMLSNYITDIIKIAKRHNSENCIVWANGDMINGNIHKSITVTNKENVIEQVTGAAELISEFLSELANSGLFNTVKFVSVAGNHSRIETKEDALMQERLDDLIEWYMKARLQNHKNIIIGACDKIDCTMYTIDIRGKLYCGVHGDYEPSPAKLTALQQMVGQPLYGILLGHLHHNLVDTVQGIKTIMAGSFLGMDDYCVSKRIYGTPEQLVCVCNSDGLVCPYFIKLNSNKNAIN